MTYDLKEIKKENYSYLTSPDLLKERSVFIAFTNRKGGSSNGPYNSLNFSFNVDDNPENVEINRLITARNMGFNNEKFTLGKQVHGNNVVLIDEKKVGQGACSHQSAIDSTDCLVTSIKSTAVAVLTADCLPVILIDETGQKVAVVHCGWRGLASKIIYGALRHFNPGETLAFLGPAIGECCYEVGKEVVLALDEPVNANQKYKISLEKIAVKQLKNNGVNQNNIYRSSLCTACNSDKFFSYRSSGGLTGRQAAIAVIK